MSEKVTTTRKPRITRNESLVDEILERIMSGESVNAICSEPGMPARKSFYMWIIEDDKLRERYESALNARVHSMSEDLLDIADAAVPTTPMGTTDTGAVAKQRLQVDTRKWLLSKLAPKKYGDKITQELTGANGGPILTKDVSDLSDAELAAIANGDKG